jgi:PIN domain-containing protein
VSGATLDAGALVGFERAGRRVVGIVRRAIERRETVAIPAGVVGQVWRDGKRQVRLVRLLASRVVDVVPLDDAAARAAGQLCGVTGTSDVIDASVILCARERGHKIVTSDPQDLRRLDDEIELVRV